MKNFVVLLVLFAGLIFSSCQKENTVAEETPTITSFEEFQEWAGDRLVYSEDKSNDEFDCYLYYSEGDGVEPIVISQLKESDDKDGIEPIRCYQMLFIDNLTIQCIASWDDCNDLGGGRIQICNWEKLKQIYW